VAGHLVHVGLIGGAALAYVMFVVLDARRRGAPWRVRRRPGRP
jgi:hypothetical protein